MSRGPLVSGATREGRLPDVCPTTAQHGERRFCLPRSVWLSFMMVNMGGLLMIVPVLMDCCVSPRGMRAIENVASSSMPVSMRMDSLVSSCGPA